ncbi:MAG: hypothetical protein M2R45_00900 [Verrucomicrobia subdivision 3 bacterium]|nr:hypothetical protein [Limisphaerales bacterium]MCS1414568.1 hypothetical protein [Limisphaerales bacterium]
MASTLATTVPIRIPISAPDIVTLRIRLNHSMALGDNADFLMNDVAQLKQLSF